MTLIGKPSCVAEAVTEYMGAGRLLERDALLPLPAQRAAPGCWQHGLIMRRGRRVHAHGFGHAGGRHMEREIR